MMTDSQLEEAWSNLLRIAAAVLSMVLFGIGVWALERITGLEPGSAVQVGLLFLAIFGGQKVVRSIGDMLGTPRITRRHDDEERP